MKVSIIRKRMDHSMILGEGDFAYFIWLGTELPSPYFWDKRWARLPLESKDIQKVKRSYKFDPNASRAGIVLTDYILKSRIIVEISDEQLLTCINNRIRAWVAKQLETV